MQDVNGFDRLGSRSGNSTTATSAAAFRVAAAPGRAHRHVIFRAEPAPAALFLIEPSVFANDQLNTSWILFAFSYITNTEYGNTRTPHTYSTSFIGELLPSTAQTQSVLCGSDMLAEN